MGQKVIGNLNVGLILGLLQFVTTFGVTAVYIRHAGKVFDRPRHESGRRWKREV